MKKILKIKRIMSNRLVWLSLGLLLLLLAYLSFELFPSCNYNWVVLLLAAFTYLLLSGLKTKIVTIKILFFNISAIFFALFLFESYLWLRDIWPPKAVVVETHSAGGYGVAHPYLGYGPKYDGIFTVKKTLDSEVIYDISYKIKDGLRYTPNSNENSENCALFFGCSFTFGQGLTDTSTLPFFFNQCAREKYKVFNYGFKGYGPHQMLSTIENRVVKDIQGFNKEKIAVYSFIPHHIHRAAGYSIWDYDGPKYEIIEDHLRKVGTFRNLPIGIDKILNKSYIYKLLLFEKKASHYDIMRAIEIMKKANELLIKQNVVLYVFVWDNPSAIENAFQKHNDYYYFLDEMKKNNIKTFFLHDAICDYAEKKNTYKLHHLEGHPNGLANEKIANYIYSQLNDFKPTTKEK